MAEQPQYKVSEDEFYVIEKRLEEQFNLYELVERRFWGTVEIQFQAGCPVVVKITETKKVRGNNPYATNTRQEL